MDKFNQAIINDYKEEFGRGTFENWEPEWIVGYYMQFVHKEMDEEEVQSVIDEANRQIKAGI